MILLKCHSIKVKDVITFLEKLDPEEELYANIGTGTPENPILRMHSTFAPIFAPIEQKKNDET